MTENPYEIPAQIRDLTGKSIEEARKAFESFIEASRKATAQAEGTAKPCNRAPRRPARRRSASPKQM